MYVLIYRLFCTQIYFMKLNPIKKKFSKRQQSRLKELAERFLESESTGAYLGRAVLAMLALGGILVIGAMAPNIFSAFGRFEKTYRNDEERVRNAVYYLRKKKFIKFVRSKNSKATAIKITKDGIVKVREFVLGGLRVETPKVWDGKWRMVIFDIPERYKNARTALRTKLKALGFYQFQKSVFAFPYPAEEEILFVAAVFNVEQYVEILTIDRMLYDSDLRRFFKL